MTLYRFNVYFEQTKVVPSVFVAPTAFNKAALHTNALFLPSDFF